MTFGAPVELPGGFRYDFVPQLRVPIPYATLGHPAGGPTIAEQYPVLSMPPVELPVRRYGYGVAHNTHHRLELLVSDSMATYFFNQVLTWVAFRLV